jgi:hypothetical protein
LSWTSVYGDHLLFDRCPAKKPQDSLTLMGQAACGIRTSAFIASVFPRSVGAGFRRL